MKKTVLLFVFAAMGACAVPPSPYTTYADPGPLDPGPGESDRLPGYEKLPQGLKPPFDELPDFDDRFAHRAIEIQAPSGGTMLETYTGRFGIIGVVMWTYDTVSKAPTVNVGRFEEGNDDLPDPVVDLPRRYRGRVPMAQGTDWGNRLRTWVGGLQTSRWADRMTLTMEPGQWYPAGPAPTIVMQPVNDHHAVIRMKTHFVGPAAGPDGTRMVPWRRAAVLGSLRCRNRESKVAIPAAECGRYAPDMLVFYRDGSSWRPTVELADAAK